MANKFKDWHQRLFSLSLCASSLIVTGQLYAQISSDIRSFDGRGNNIDQPMFGSSGVEGSGLPVLNQFEANYGPRSRNAANPRAISNAVARQGSQRHSQHNLSDLFWLWGQFLDHDITLIPHGSQKMPIAIPADDDFFNGGIIDFTRSQQQTIAGERRPLNTITSFIDASQVYGSTTAVATALRDSYENMYMAESDFEFLPLLDDVPVDDGSTGRRGLFAAGDVRANEHVGLTAIHTIFLREHNRIIPIIQRAEPNLSSDAVYQKARLVLGGIMQKISYDEFLPKLIGRNLPPYFGYDPSINPAISNSFATAAFRFGHSMLSSELKILEVDGTLTPISLRDVFFQPQIFIDFGPEAILSGFSQNKAQAIDNQIVDDVRSFLFGPPGSPGSDLAAINVQRGRDHELPLYNEMRYALGYPRVTKFLKNSATDRSGITTDRRLAANLASVYGSVDEVDLWVGGLAEDAMFGSLLGETFTSIITEQFLRLRAGDRFWYENHFPSGYLRDYINRSSLSAVLRRNGDGSLEIDSSPFEVD